MFVKVTFVAAAVVTIVIIVSVFVSVAIVRFICVNNNVGNRHRNPNTSPPIVIVAPVWVPVLILV